MVGITDDSSAEDDCSNGNEKSSLLMQKINVLLSYTTTNGYQYRYCVEHLLAALVLLTRVPNDNEFTLLMTTAMNLCGGIVFQTIKASETVNDDDDSDSSAEETDLHYPNASLYHLVVRIFVQLLHRTW